MLTPAGAVQKNWKVFVSGRFQRRCRTFGRKLVCTHLFRALARALGGEQITMRAIAANTHAREEFRRIGSRTLRHFLFALLFRTQTLVSDEQRVPLSTALRERRVLAGYWNIQVAGILRFLPVFP